MAHSFTTTKAAQGFNWSITQTTHDETTGRGRTVTLKTGHRATRAQATGIAKKWLLFVRRGGVI